MKITKFIALVSVCLSPFTQLHAQPQFTAAMLDQFEQQGPVDPATLPPGTFWLASSLLNGDGGPPLPFSPDGLPTYILDAQQNTYIVDDISDEAAAILSQRGQRNSAEFELPPFDGGDDGGGDTNSIPQGWFTPLYDASMLATNLWLEIPSVSNGLANLILHNTTNTMLYGLLSHEVLGDGLSCSNWPVELFVWGASGTTNTATTVPMGDRTNLFFWAYGIPPTNAAALAILNNSYTCSAIVNAAQTNQYTAFYSTLVAFGAPLYSLNLGYNGEDWVGVTYLPEPGYTLDHYQNSAHHWDNPDPQGYLHGQQLAQQNVLGLAFSPDALTTLTNVFVSHNPITELNLQGATAIKDIECYNCLSLTSVNVTGCQNLWRACFEECAVQGVLDFTGCTNLVDIRGANNQLQGLVLGDAAPKLNHLCVRDNPTLATMDASGLHSVRDFYIWNCNQRWPITAATLPSTKLYDVEIYSNRFEHLDLSGQSNLFWLDAFNNNLTNVLLTNCSGLYEVKLQNNQLGSNALDNVLAALDASPNVPYTVDLRANADYPSTSVGWQHYTSLLARQQSAWVAGGATINCDWPPNWPPPSPINAGAGWTNFQAVMRNDGNSLPFTSPNTAGNLLICAVRSWDSTDIVSISDSQGNNWISVTSNSVPYYAGWGYTGYLRVYYCTNCNGGANTVTVTAGSDPVAMELTEWNWNGVTAAAQVDVYASAAWQTNTSGGIQGLTAGSIATSQTNDMVFAFAACANGPLTDASTGFTNLVAGAHVFGEWKLQGEANSIRPTVTTEYTGNETYGMISVAFKHR